MTAVAAFSLAVPPPPGLLDEGARTISAAGPGGAAAASLAARSEAPTGAGVKMGLGTW